MTPDRRHAQFEALLLGLKTNRGFDFTGYKRSTLVRRVAKRMAALHVDTYGAYEDYLEAHPEEFAPLFDTMLINVTAFFRDPPVWTFLAQEIIPRVVAGKTAADSIRVCCVGCASGEEAYSVAMLFSEALGEKTFRKLVKIYATDVDGDALMRARRATYDHKAIEAVPAPLREKYFEAAGNSGFTVRGDLRRAVIFGRHDLVQDAPISRLDLLVCRNTLMYFTAETQPRILARFHFALKDGGFLVLGKSEMLLNQGDLFTPVDMKQRVFAKTPRANLPNRVALLAPKDDNEAGNDTGQQVRIREVAFDIVALPQLLVDAGGRLALASGPARQLFGIAPSQIGKPLQDLEVSYRPIELRSVIQQAKAESAPVTVREVKHVDADGTIRYFDVEVTPLNENGNRALGISVSFTEVTQSRDLQQALRHTNEELETANEELQSMNEELETTNEELQSTNEELETTNEELQATNEELETMNEELQATNEELETTNDQLQVRTEESKRTDVLLNAVLNTLRVGVALVNARHQVLGWNAMAAELWGLRAEEAHGENIFQLEIGLPLDKVKTGMRACLAGEKNPEGIVLKAVNRRGRKIACRVTCKAFAISAEERGAILLMEEMP
jgi:two-component system, chemotaxis family, CheB/CheR fusion protein